MDAHLKDANIHVQKKFLPQVQLTPPMIRLVGTLSEALPSSVLLHQNPTDALAIEKSMNAYWAKQETEAIPACIVQPKTEQELSLAVSMIKQTFTACINHPDPKQRGDVDGFFAVRSGGHSPVSGAASIWNGVLIDMSYFDQVEISEDGKSVKIGVGARWGNVYSKLEDKGLAVVGGRNSEVGVGGLVLGGVYTFFFTSPSVSPPSSLHTYLVILSICSCQPSIPLLTPLGGLSSFSPTYGFVCSNISSYTLILASGLITTASFTSHPTLWRALKGGSNNFGIVTHITMPTFPCTAIWSGFLYLPGFQAPKVLSAFHTSVNRVLSADPEDKYDSAAAGPIACFTYLQKLGIQAISVNLVHTNPTSSSSSSSNTPKKGAWPQPWRTSPFNSLFRFWSTCRVRSLRSATQEMSALNPPGRRQEFGTTTVVNDLATLRAVHAFYGDGVGEIRERGVKGMSWTLVLQPLLPQWARLGEENPLGFHVPEDKSTGKVRSERPLVNVSFTVNWEEKKDDVWVQGLIRRAVEKIEETAEGMGTAHRYKYLNYCGSWQKPFEGYGEGEHMWLREVAEKYDEHGLFQRGFAGGFKLWGEGTSSSWRGHWGVV
jgi:hypothetical protein